MGHVARVDGVELVITRAWSRSPRVAREGHELPHDRWGNYEFTGADGLTRPVEVGFDWRHLGPRLLVGDEAVAVGRPVPVWARVALLAFMLVGLLGGALGATFFLAAAIGSATLLRRSDRSTMHVALAVALPLLAAVAYLLVAVLVGGRS